MKTVLGFDSDDIGFHCARLPLAKALRELSGAPPSDLFEASPASDALHAMRRASEVDHETFSFLSRFEPACQRPWPQRIDPCAGLARRQTLLLLLADGSRLMNWCDPVLSGALSGRAYGRPCPHQGESLDSRWFRVRAIELGADVRTNLAGLLSAHKRGGSIMAVGDAECGLAHRALLAAHLDPYAVRVAVLRATHTAQGRALRLLAWPTDAPA